MVSLVITILGPDRPGIVEVFASRISEHGGNWLESSLSRLAGKFAGVIRIEVALEQVDALRSALRGFEEEGIHVIVEQADASGEVPAQRILKLELIGQDQPGIVRDVTRTLRERGINVDELDTEIRNAPMSGEQLFWATAVLSVPTTTDIEELDERLEAIAGQLHLDMTLSLTV